MLTNLLNSTLAILQAFDKENVELLRKYNKESGQYTTGKTSAAFGSDEQIDDYSVNAKTFGPAHIGALEYGRKPSANGIQPGALNAIILEWVRNKGVLFQDNIKQSKYTQQERTANTITYFIHKKGTYMYRYGKTFNDFTNPISKAFDESRINKLREQLGLALMPTISSEVLNQFKKQ